MWQLRVFVHICVCVWAQTTCVTTTCIHSYLGVCDLKLHVTTMCMLSYLCVLSPTTCVITTCIRPYLCVISNYMRGNYVYSFIFVCDLKLHAWQLRVFFHNLCVLSHTTCVATTCVVHICVCDLKLHAWQLRVVVHICVCDLKLHVTTTCILSYLCDISSCVTTRCIHLYLCVISNYMCDNMYSFIFV